MDTTNLADLGRDARQSGLLEEGIDARIMDALLDVHTALPGVLTAYDPATNLASVQVAVNRFFFEQGWVKVPLLVDVPVKHLRGGGWSVTVPYAAGDECLVVFAERDIDGWHQQGGQQNPIDPRMHSFSDGFALVGFNSSKHALPSVAVDALELRSDDRQTLVSLQTGKVVIRQGTQATVTVLADHVVLQVGDTVLTVSATGVTLVGNLQVNGAITHTP